MNPVLAETSSEVKLSEVMSALSYALDITEGQPEGHAVRTCLLGMRIGEELGLSAERRSALFYALLLKDLGCSSNAARMCELYLADDQPLKADTKTVDWQRPSEALRFIAGHTAPEDSPIARAIHTVSLALRAPKEAKAVVETRCERGAEIARMLEFPEETSAAIRALDEHWNGKGSPYGLEGEQIPLLGRIACLAQTVEVFFSSHGVEAACEMARERRGRWFDPALVDVLLSFEHDAEFWRRLGDDDVRAQVAEVEPEDRVLTADEDRVDGIAEAFARVIDAKSPWTYRHSDRVSRIAVGMAEIRGFGPERLRRLRRAALLHDIGKLGISNRIWDKQGKLTDEEWAQVRKHPEYTRRILERVTCFRELAEPAAAHHEKLDGSGYHRGVTGEELDDLVRVLAVADQCEALAAERPYRGPLPREKVLEIMGEDVGTQICAASFAALEAFLEGKGEELIPPAD